MKKNETQNTSLWGNRKKILEGLKNTLLKNEIVEEIAAARNTICKACPKFSTSSADCLVPGTAPCCKHCGCCLHLKQRSLSSECPDGLWPAVITQQEEDSLNNG